MRSGTAVTCQLSVSAATHGFLRIYGFTHTSFSRKRQYSIRNALRHHPQLVGVRAHGARLLDGHDRAYRIFQLRILRGGRALHMRRLPCQPCHTRAPPLGAAPGYPIKAGVPPTATSTSSAAAGMRSGDRLSHDILHFGVVFNFIRLLANWATHLLSNSCVT